MSVHYLIITDTCVHFIHVSTWKIVEKPVLLTMTADLTFHHEHAMYVRKHTAIFYCQIQPDISRVDVFSKPSDKPCKQSSTLMEL